MGFDFEIQYKAGPTNNAADVLSRKHVGEVILNSLVTVPIVSWKILEEEIEKDVTLQRLKQDLRTNEREHHGFTLLDDKLLFKGRYVIPQSSSFRTKLLQEYHDSAIGGHSGKLHTYD